MPRKNRYIKHIPYRHSSEASHKVRYPSKKAAERAAKEVMLLNQHVFLRVYKEIDGGWYLTKQNPPLDKELF